MALMHPARPAITSRRISGLGLVLDNKEQGTSSPKRRTSTAVVRAEAEPGPPLVPIVAVTRVDGLLELNDLVEASPKYEEVDSQTWGQSTAVCAGPIDPHRTPKARTSSTFPVPSSASTWLFGDDEANSPLVLSEKLPALAWYTSRRLADIGAPPSAEVRENPRFAAPFGPDDQRFVDSTGLPSYAAVMTPPTLVTPTWLDTPTQLERARLRRAKAAIDSPAEWGEEATTSWRSYLSQRRWAVASLVGAWCVSLVFAVTLLRSASFPGSWTMRHAPDHLLAEDLLERAYPTRTLVENLRPDTRYLIGGQANAESQGLTEYFVSSYKLLYLGKLLHRVSIVPGLAPPPTVQRAPMALSSIFDLSLLHDRQLPFLEVADAKAPVLPNLTNRGEEESIGCWSSSQLVSTDATGPSTAFSTFGLDLQPWPLPEKSIARAVGGHDLLFESIVAFDWEHERKSSWISSLSPSSKGKPRPTEQLFCLDDTLHLGHAMFSRAYGRPSDGQHHSVGPHSPLSGDDQAWVQIGQHLRFRRALVYRADEALRRILNSGLTSPVAVAHTRFPRFVAVRMATSVPVAQYAAAVDRVRNDLGLKNLSNRRGSSSLKTLVFLDGELSPSLRAEVRAKGWILAADDQEWRNEGQMGEVMEQIMMTRGAGFVGTVDDPTSGVTALRAAFWHGQPTAVVARE